MEFGSVNRWGIYKRLMDYLTPGCCLLCDALVSEGSQLCPGCAVDGPAPHSVCQHCGGLLRARGTICSCVGKPRTLDRILAVRAYHYPVNSLVQEMKYHGQLGLCREFGFSIAGLAHSTCSTLPDCLIPVPMHRSRLRERGYNQALEIAHAVSARLDLLLETNLLSRVRSTVPQIDLDPESRARNVRGAFVLHNAGTYEHVAIVDDVFTTGATAFELAKLLKSSGIRKVELWSYAIALK